MGTLGGKVKEQFTVSTSKESPPETGDYFFRNVLLPVREKSLQRTAGVMICRARPRFGLWEDTEFHVGDSDLIDGINEGGGSKIAAAFRTPFDFANLIVSGDHCFF